MLSGIGPGGGRAPPQQNNNTLKFNVPHIVYINSTLGCLNEIFAVPLADSKYSEDFTGFFYFFSWA